MNAGFIEARYAVDRAGFSLDVDLKLPTRGVIGVVGPSGAGKTTLLRCMTGLERSRSAFLSVGDTLLDDSEQGRGAPPYRRRIAVVFQEPRLFAHLDVTANILYGARRSEGQPVVEFDSIVELLGIGDLLSRRTRGLSGGEAQRVAIARALMSAPRLMLFDEPLASLDQARRDEILPFLEALHAALPVPMIYVSHQYEEMLRLADYLVFMQSGRVSHHGALSDVLDDRASLPRDATAVVLDGVTHATDTEFGLTEVATDAGSFWVASLLDPGSPLRLIVRANDVSVAMTAPENSSIQNAIPATIVSIDEEEGATALLALDCNGTRLLARITRRAVAELDLSPGRAVFALVKTAAVRNAQASVPLPT